MIQEVINEVVKAEQEAEIMIENALAAAKALNLEADAKSAEILSAARAAAKAARTATVAAAEKEAEAQYNAVLAAGAKEAEQLKNSIQIEKIAEEIAAAFLKETASGNR